MSAPHSAPTRPPPLPQLLEHAIAGRESAPYLGVRTSTSRDRSLTLRVHPEDVEAALVAEGLVEPVVYEAEPGRIAMAYRAGAAFSDQPADEETALAAAVKSANRRLADHRRIAGRAPFPEPDFPRTHTRKVRRGAVADRMAEVPLSR